MFGFSYKNFKPTNQTNNKIYHLQGDTKTFSNPNKFIEINIPIDNNVYVLKISVKAFTILSTFWKFHKLRIFSFLVVINAMF